MNTTNIAISRSLYQEGNYTCMATSKYGNDLQHFVLKGKKIKYVETNAMHTESWLVLGTRLYGKL